MSNRLDQTQSCEPGCSQWQTCHIFEYMSIITYQEQTGRAYCQRLRSQSKVIYGDISVSVIHQTLKHTWFCLWNVESMFRAAKAFPEDATKIKRDNDVQSSLGW